MLHFLHLKYSLQTVLVFFLFYSSLSAQHAYLGNARVLFIDLEAVLDMSPKKRPGDDFLAMRPEFNEYDTYDYTIQVKFTRQIGDISIGGSVDSQIEDIIEDQEVIMGQSVLGFIAYEAPLDVIIGGHIGRGRMIMELKRDFAIKDNILLKFLEELEFNEQFLWSFKTYLFYTLRKQFDFTVKYSNDNFGSRSLEFGTRISF